MRVLSDSLPRPAPEHLKRWGVTIQMLVTATTGMGQLERGLNRLYGVEQDRPMLHKYGRAFASPCEVGSARSVAGVSSSDSHSPASLR